MGVEAGPDGRSRCWWCLGAPELLAYHDHDWGRPVHDDRTLFEMLVLESFQSGLAWLTILRKREGFRHAFADWDIERISTFGERDVERLLGDAAIVRHRGKIEATIANANAALQMRESDETLDELLWGFAPGHGHAPAPRNGREIPARTPESIAMSKELTRRGFRYVGPITAYSLMEATGLVDDHIDGCEWRSASDLTSEPRPS